ncbi:hypothetical protein PR048_003958 [Dryococelus australis]|uniref:Ig-like domain-containing protein n=1 Tax=Dryococelus australis TaxID=614101 RepID=A0ABQ9I566_9NEOP|nr:hypothetical protein PR048_003958 [Dryococelus australis]
MSGKRDSLSLMKKYEIITEVDKQKTPKVEIARQHGIPKLTLFPILKMREEIVHTVQKEGCNVQLKNLQCTTHGDLEEALLEWFGQVRSQHLPANGPMVQKKADELALRLERPQLLPASRLVQCRRAGDVLYLMSERTLAVKGDVCKGTKRSKECLTVLCCKMDGSDKMKPSKAWMTSAVFTRWFCCFGAKMGAANRKVVLFVDNCSPHSELDNLRNIELPNNTTSMLQPLDQGIIQQAKLKFKEMHEESTKRLPSTCFSLQPAPKTPPVDAEPQHSLSTLPQSAHLTVTRPCDEETSQQFAPNSTFEEFVTADDDIAVWGTVDNADDVMSRGSRSRVVKKNLLMFPRRETYSRPGMSMPQC